MINIFAAQVGQYTDKAVEHAEEYSGLFGSIKAFIIHYFGEYGLVAACIVLATVVILVISRLAKVALATAIYLIIPAVALAFVGASVLSYSFATLLPVTATACCLILLFKG